MKGEEFFGEVKEERLIDRDLSWLLFFAVVFALCYSVFVHLKETIGIESYSTWSYWLEVMGFVLIVGDLFYREQTERFLSLGSGYFTPGDVNWIGWWKFAALYLFFSVICVFIGRYLKTFGGAFDAQVVEFDFFFPVGAAIFSGPYFYVLDKMNDRLLASGVGLATTGLTFATSAQIRTTFF